MDRLGDVSPDASASRTRVENSSYTKCTNSKKINIYGRARRRQSYLRYRIGAIAIAFSISCILSVYSIKHAKNELENAALHGGRYGRAVDDPSNSTFPPIDVEDNSTKECINATFNEFPTDGLTHEQRKGGAIIIHILISVYMFLGLAIICDDYFVASLEQIVEKLKLSDDVAGATFMAAGSSAPELFTSLIGVFIAKSDVGTGTIVGSAVFNILVIIGLCALFCNEAIQLSWWPLVRDSSYYLMAILTLIVVMYDEVVYWYEAMIMIILYLGYIIIMKFNSQLQGIAIKIKASTCGGSSKKGIKTEETNGTDVSVGMLPKETAVYTAANGQTVATVDEVAGIRFQSNTPNNEMATVGMRMMISNNFAPKTRLRMASRLLIMERKNILAARENTTVHGETERMLLREETSKMSDDGEDDEESYVNPFRPPKESFSDFMKWFISWPLLFLFFFTIPNCSSDRFAKWFLLTFLMSIVWITLFSYVMVWMICLTGYTLGIPDTVMGITFLAAGTSVPDTIASVLVARNGYGDMAVSNSIGSNVFDIFLGLGLPWLLKTTIRPMNAGPTVEINSKGLLLSVGLLMLSLIIVVVSIHLNKWQLTRRLGWGIMCTYAVFLVFSILIETNTFMNINPPTCKMH